MADWGGMDWASLTVAGAFAAGALLGTVGTLVVTRLVIKLLTGNPVRPLRRPEPDDGTSSQDCT